jgi:hypothetical protein
MSKDLSSTNVLGMASSVLLSILYKYDSSVSLTPNVAILRLGIGKVMESARYIGITMSSPPFS